MKKGMFITMGTSLFHSATWEPGAGALAGLQKYEEWTSPDLLKSPEKRLSSASATEVRNSLKILLKAENAEEWWGYAARDLAHGDPNPNTLMRFSAELTTVLKLAQEEPAKSDKLSDFLSSYDEILLAFDPDNKDQGPNLPKIASYHLYSYLSHLGKSRIVLQAIPGLSDPSPATLLDDPNRGLRKLARIVAEAGARNEQMDFILSGGYKIYGIFLHPLLREERRNFRLIYLHEEGSKLLVITKSPVLESAPMQSEETVPSEETQKRILSLLDNERYYFKLG